MAFVTWLRKSRYVEGAGSPKGSPEELWIFKSEEELLGCRGRGSGGTGREWDLSLVLGLYKEHF